MQKYKSLVGEKLDHLNRRVLILNTGGTISMFPSEHGYVTKRGCLRDFMRNNPYLCDLDYTYFQATGEFLITPESIYQRRIWYTVRELDELLDSSNIVQKNWLKIASIIKEEYRNFDAFIILHGTDTMAYTASALSFMFENLSKTIVITGSQVPLS
jgi:lysophospholipase